MLKKYFIVAFFVLVYSQGYAVLSPFYQSTKEIASLINDPRFVEAFRTKEHPSVYPVVKIERTEKGYRVYSDFFYLDADILYSYSSRPGPIIFDWNFHEAVDIDVM